MNGDVETHWVRPTRALGDKLNEWTQSSAYIGATRENSERVKQSSIHFQLYITVYYSMMRSLTLPLFFHIHFSQQFTQFAAWVVNVSAEDTITHATVATIIFISKVLYQTFKVSRHKLNHHRSLIHHCVMSFLPRILSLLFLLGRSWEISLHNGMFCAPAV